MQKLIIHTNRDAYSIDQISSTMTVGELMEILSDYDEDTPIYLNFDNGYTFGRLSDGLFEDAYDEEDQ